MAKKIAVVFVGGVGEKGTEESENGPAGGEQAAHARVGRVSAEKRDLRVGMGPDNNRAKAKGVA